MKAGEEFTGLGCQVFPGGGSIDITVRMPGDDEPHSDMWFGGHLRVKQPKWASQYLALEHFYFQSPGPSSKRGYAPIAAALRTILSAVAAEVAALAEGGTLTRLGFAKSAALTVWTEDDEVEAGYARVARARRARRRAGSEAGH